MIKVDENYVIRDCGDCYIAEYVKGTRFDKKAKKDVPVAESLGYFGKIEGAVRACKNHAVRKNVAENDYDMNGAIEMIAKTTAHFENVLKKAVGDN